jgi:hypothetical protein
VATAVAGEPEEPCRAASARPLDMVAVW